MSNRLRVFWNNLINLPTLLAIRILTRALRKDKGFYYSYQANIAMAFFDEFRRQAETPEIIRALNQANLNVHSIANDAANNFMRSWIKEGDRP